MRDRFGAHKVLREHVGGMSPGCATSLATADGGRVFVKAVGQELHERTTENFRREAELLRRLPDVDYRPRLLDMFEDGGWVALCLQHIDGENPGLTDDRDFDAVADADCGDDAPAGRRRRRVPCRDRGCAGRPSGTTLPGIPAPTCPPGRRMTRQL